MKLIKKLVIMSGRGYEKGTVALEKNAVSISGRTNLHNLRNLSHEEYVLIIICANTVHFVDVGNFGTSTKQFVLPYEADISTLHCAVTVGDTVALYGTTESKRMWEGNIIDIARRKRVESKKDNIEKPKEKNTQAEMQNTVREKSINDYFLNIMTDYNDEAVAEVNYYSNNEKSHNSKTNIRPKLTEKYYDKLHKASECEIQDNPLNSGHEENFCPPVQNQEQSQEKIELIEPAAAENSEEQAREETLARLQDSFKPSVNSSILKEEDDEGEPKKEIESNDYCLANINDCACKESTIQSCDESFDINNSKQNNFSQNETNSQNRYGCYYENLKEKYGYNRSVINDYRNDQESDSTRINSNQCGKKEPGNENFSDKKEDDLNMSNNLRDSKFRKLSNASNESNIGKKQSENTCQTPYNQNCGEQKKNISPISEVASALGIKSVPPLESSFSRIRLGTYYEQIKKQLDDIFKNNPHNAELESLIPDSKWVRVDYNDDGKFYVIGIIGKPDYICYGVPALYSLEPPAELDGYCQWLPLDINNPTKHGYWLLFQDAVSGESVKNEII